MKSVLVFDYWGTGEGRTLEIYFTNSSRVTDEEAIQFWKASKDEWFHVGLEVIPLDEVADNKHVSQTVKTHVPSLYEFINSDRDYIFKCDYKTYYNYS